MTATDTPIGPTAPQVDAPRGVAPRRRPRLFAALWVVFALWVAALVAMYFGTVYPQRHPHDGRPAIVVPAAG